MLAIAIGKELVVEIRGGSKAAFKKLYATYAPALLGYISKFIADKKDAEHILQGVFIAIWNNMHTPGAEPLFTWLLRITRNSIRAFLDENGAGENQNIISFVNIHNIDAMPLKSDIAGAVLKEVYFNGCSIQDVAARLNIEKGAAQKMLRDAIVDLKNVPQ